MRVRKRLCRGTLAWAVSSSTCWSGIFAEFLSKENVASVNKYHDSSRAHRKASLGGKSSPQARKGCRTSASQCPLWICSTYVLSNQETIGGMTATLSERFKTLKVRVQAVQVIAIPIPMTLHPGMSTGQYCQRASDSKHPCWQESLWST